MLDPATINPFTLSSVPHRTALTHQCQPSTSAWANLGKCCTLGKLSIWLNAGLLTIALSELEGKGSIQLAWFQCPLSDLEFLEDRLIAILEPSLNGTPTGACSYSPLPIGLTFRNWFFLRRRQLKFSQDDVASALGVSGQTVSNWERGKSIPTLTIDQVKTLCKILNCTLDEIPTGEEASN